MKLKTPTVVEHAGSGLLMPEETARRIDDLAKGLPADFGYRRLAAVPSEVKLGQLDDGSRTDVSMVTTDDVDRDNEVVLPGGLDLADFLKNPAVFYAHDYTRPVGKCLWVKPQGNGLAALTKYARKPAAWEGPWLPDAVHSMMQEGIGTGKSIGFIPLGKRAPTAEELARRPDWKRASCLIDRGVMLEYSVAPLPANPAALSLAVSKCMAAGTVTRELADFLVGSMSAAGGDGTGGITAAGKTLKTAGPHSYSCALAHLAPADAEKVRAAGRKVPDEHLAGDGREHEPHVTVKYGLHTENPDTVRKALAGEGPIRMTLRKVAHFPGVDGGKADAVHCLVESEDLHRIHGKLSGALASTETHPAYKPHVTLAYVAPGRGRDYDGMDDLDGTTLTVDKVAFHDRAGVRTEIPLTGPAVPGAEPAAKVAAEAASSAAPMPECPNCLTADGVCARDDYEGDMDTGGMDGTYVCDLCATSFDKPEPAAKAVLNAACADRAAALLAAGEAEAGPWSFTASDRDKASPDDYLDSECRYPVIKGGRLYRRALSAVAGRAAAGRPEVAERAKALLAELGRREAAARKAAEVERALAVPFVRPEAVAAARRRQAEELKAALPAMVRRELSEALARARGKV